MCWVSLRPRFFDDQKNEKAGQSSFCQKVSDSGGSGGSDVGEEGQRPKVAPAVEKKEHQAEKEVCVKILLFLYCFCFF